MPSTIYIWTKAPFIRLLACLMIGIILQWHIQISLRFLLIAFTACAVILVAYSVLKIKFQYSFKYFIGFSIQLLIVISGAVLVWMNDVRHDEKWLGHHYNNQKTIVVTLEEPLVEKANSYKALATVHTFYQNDSSRSVQGKIIIYFKKDSSINTLSYGSQIVFAKSLQKIKNSGNPGSFDYTRYSLFSGITHQVYLTATDFEVLPATNQTAFKEIIFACRKWVISTLKKYIAGEKESGLAEALLIGYKDDLDKNLVEAYSNTGVVHVIAISGLHLGLIYWLLLFVTKPLKKVKGTSWPRLALILFCLWAFTLLAGAQPSVLRSAIMFTFLAIGEVIAKRSSIYNTLALSAFVLLCINPFWIWDVGFQLSYAAVLSIIMFFRPVYNWLYVKNKALDFLWKLNAVTIAAQLLTVPISMYHFHQFPALFIFTNFVAVPLSSIILIGEIALCLFSLLPPLATLLGKLLHYLIYWMNSYIEELNKIPFAVWTGFSLSILQSFILIAFVILFCYWLMEKQKMAAWLSLACLVWFIGLRTLSFTNSYRQRKLVVYNVPKYQAIDVIDGRSYHFIGDSILLLDDFIRNFHLNPSRILHRIPKDQSAITMAKHFSFAGKNILIIDTFPITLNKENIDVLILSRNPKLYIAQLAKAFSINQIIIDGSVPFWKAAYWKKDCDSLKIPCHDVAEKGAFVMNL